MNRWVKLVAHTGIGMILLIWTQAGLAQQSSNTATDIPVSARLLEEVVIYPESRISATVLSLRHAKLSVEASGVVKKIFVQMGDQVDAGQKLLELDCRNAEFSQRLAQSSRSLAKKEWRRAEKLNSSHTIPEQQFNQAKAAFEQASIALNQAKLRVENCTLEAPYAGTITARYAQLGNLFTSGMPAFQLLDTQKIEGEASLSSKQMAAINKATDLIFETQGLSYAVRFRVGQAFVDAQSSQRDIRFEFKPSLVNVEQPFPLVGSTGWLSWKNITPHLPSNLLLERQQVLGYFIGRDGRAIFQPLVQAKFGHSTPLTVFDSGVRVIIDGRNRLVDGDVIKISSGE